MRTITGLRLKRDRQGVSNIIVVVLSLVIIIAIASNVFLWSYQMNQLDWEKMQEIVKISNVTRISAAETLFTFRNEGALTSHLVSMWIINSTNHERYDINVIVNSGETLNYTRVDISLPSGQYAVKVVTERGNIAVYLGT